MFAYAQLNPFYPLSTHHVRKDTRAWRRAQGYTLIMCTQSMSCKPRASCSLVLYCQLRQQKVAGNYPGFPLFFGTGGGPGNEANGEQ